MCMRVLGGVEGEEGEETKSSLVSKHNIIVLRKKMSELFECSTLGMVQSRFSYSPH